jgi:hypothetical protein
MGLALVERRLSEKSSSEMSLSDTLMKKNLSLALGKPSNKIQEDLHPSESSIIAASSLSAVSPTKSVGNTRVTTRVAYVNVI